MKYLLVEKSKLIANLGRIRDRAGKARIIAVLKANGYGLGLIQMARFLQEQGVRMFAVTDPSEARRLRQAGCADEEILVLRSTTNEQEIREILEVGATAAIGSYDAAVALNGVAEQLGMSCDVHIQINVGMGRYGFDPAELDRVLSVYRFLPCLHVTGIFTHFPRAYQDKDVTAAQCQVFLDVVQKLRDSGCEPGMIHAANSAALFYCNLPELDGVRVGSALTGRITAKGNFALQKTGKLVTQVTELRWLTKGQSTGYGSVFTARKPVRVAILPVGTADGFMVEKARDSFRLRDCIRYMLSDLLSFLRRRRRPTVLINGKRARVIGHVGMNHTAVDVTNLDCVPGTRAELEVSPMFVPPQINRQYE